MMQKYFAQIFGAVSFIFFFLSGTRFAALQQTIG